MFQHIKLSLRKRLTTHGAIEPVEGARITEAIMRLLVQKYGTQTAEQIHVRSVRAGVIELTAHSSSVCHDILMAHDELIKDCNARLGGSLVSRIRCTG